MFGAFSAYVVSIGTLLFCATSALTLFHVVDHFDPPNPTPMPKAADFKIEVDVREKVAI